MLNKDEKRIHGRALFLSRKHRTVESDLVDILGKVLTTKLYVKLDKESVFTYAVEALGLAESTAYALIAVAKMCIRIPVLRTTIANHRLTVPKAARILSIMTEQNAEEIMAFAQKSTWREIEREVARRNPKAANPNRAKYLAANLVQLSITISHAAYEKHLRVKEIEAQRGNTGDFQEKLYDEYLFKHDKVKKAERAQARSERVKKYSVRTEKRRKPLPAAIEHAVHLRDRGRCTHTDQNGKRCKTERWTDIHHIIPLSRGGTDKLENLTTLCRFHHRQLHRSEWSPPDDHEFC